ncbi:MAG: hypothetical protein K9L85_02855 [Candidatus Peribacteraceae bacterium]|nr:hypothetical protein [Candidatus Peribacteraceae bacterium]
MWVDYFWQFPSADFDAITWCFRDLGLPHSPIDFEKIGEFILKKLRPEGIFMTRILCEKVLKGDNLPRDGAREAKWFTDLFGESWRDNFSVKNGRILSSGELQLHDFLKYDDFPDAVEVVLQKCV